MRVFHDLSNSLGFGATVKVLINNLMLILRFTRKFFLIVVTESVKLESIVTGGDEYSYNFSDFEQKMLISVKNYLNDIILYWINFQFPFAETNPLMHILVIPPNVIFIYEACNITHYQIIWLPGSAKIVFHV